MGDRGDWGETTLEAVERKQLGVDASVSSFGSGAVDGARLSSVGAGAGGSEAGCESGRAVANVRLLRLLAVRGEASSMDHERTEGGGSRLLRSLSGRSSSSTEYERLSGGADRLWSLLTVSPSVSAECERLNGGGDSTVAKGCPLGEMVVALAKFKSSSFSSTMASGMTRDGRSLSLESGGEDFSSDRNRRRASGDISRERVPSGVVEPREVSEAELPRRTSGRSSGGGGDGTLSMSGFEALRVKRRFQAGAGEEDRDEELMRRCEWAGEGAVAIRGTVVSAGTGGARRGVINFASGLTVLKSPARTELREALRCRRLLSMGTLSVLTV